MPFFTGFAGEFGRQLGENRRLEADRAERQSQLETSILQHLSSSTDPEIASRAVAGMLGLVGPSAKRSKGLRGFLGETDANPNLPMLRDFIMAGRPGGEESSAPAPAPVPGSAAMPATSVQTPGATMGSTPPPGTPGAPTLVTPTPGASTATTPGAAPKPRQVFRLPEEQALATGQVEVGLAGPRARAAEIGQLQGKLDVIRGTGGSPAMTPPERFSIFGRTIPAPRNLPGVMQDDQGNWFREREVYNPDTGVYDKERYAVAAPTGLMGTGQTVVETRIGADGKPHAYNVFYPRDGSEPEIRGERAAPNAVMIATDPVTQQQYPVQTPRGLAMPSPPAGTVAPAAAPPAAPAAAPAATAPPPLPPGAVPTMPMATAPPAFPAAGGSTRPPARGASAGAPAGSPAARPQTRPTPQGSVAAPPPAGTPGRTGVLGRKRDLQQVEGAFLGPGGQPTIGTAFLDKGLGQYFDATDPSRPAQGFIPGEMGAYAVQAYNSANATLNTIAAAKKALEDAGLTTNNDVNATMGFMQKFYQGTSGGEILNATVGSLTNLAALQGATQYVRSNSRSYQMFQQAIMHLPRAPTERTAAASAVVPFGLGPKLITPNTSALAGAHGWDSPQSMYEKLNRAEEISQQGKASLTELVGKTPGHAFTGQPGPGGAGAAPGAAPASAAPPPGPVKGERRMIDGKLGEWDGVGWLPVKPGGGQ